MSDDEKPRAMFLAQVRPGKVDEAIRVMREASGIEFVHEEKLQAKVRPGWSLFSYVIPEGGFAEHFEAIKARIKSEPSVFVTE